jgi:hypothetical protein
LVEVAESRLKTEARRLSGWIHTARHGVPGVEAAHRAARLPPLAENRERLGYP